MAEKTTVPLLDLKAQYATIRDEIAEAMEEVIESQWFIMGPNVKSLEDDIASYCNTKFAIGCASGTDAILLALMAIGIEPGDEVICPSYTFFATGGCIHRLGAKPVFADIDPVTYNMDPASVREAASKCKRLKAIMPVHLFGQAVDMDAMLKLGEELNVPIIEDAAQAIGTEDSQGIRTGSRGTVGCFSFFPSKNLGAFGDGGICTMNDERLAGLIGILRVHGGKPKYYHKIVGVNSRLDALQAAILRVKLKYLDSWTAGRQENAAAYDRIFAEAGAATSATPLHEGGFPLRTPQPASRPARHIYNQYVIRVPAAIRDELRDELKDRGVGTEVYYPVPLHLQECFAYLGHSRGDLPHSEQAADQTIALPIYPELTDEQINHVARTVVSFVGSRNPAAV
ncbi:MAG: DegT/DnrJ/EryC1/StrS family aminotransferase [Phycisphaerales bacterium]|nr:MAG: DegT/DnrJ/EryC1/StrS family aminotransferase [Phycisphaerales bacterium]